MRNLRKLFVFMVVLGWLTLNYATIKALYEMGLIEAGAGGFLFINGILLLLLTSPNNKRNDNQNKAS